MEYSCVLSTRQDYQENEAHKTLSDICHDNMLPTE